MSKFKANKIVTKANVYAALDKMPEKMRDQFELIDVSIVGGKLGGSDGPRRVRLWAMYSLEKSHLAKISVAPILRLRLHEVSKIPIDRIEVEVTEWDPMIAAMES